MADRSYSFAIAVSEKSGSPIYLPVVKSNGLNPMDKGTLAMFEALYNGGKSPPIKTL